MSKNDEVKVSDVIEYMKLGNLSPHKNIGNVETESDKINHVDMSDDKDYTERDDIIKDYEGILTDFDEESYKIDHI